MTEQLGTENLKKEIDLALTIVNIVIQARADGKLDMADFALLLQLIPVLGPAGSAMGQVVPELKDLDEAEGLTLVAYVVAKLATDDKKAALIVEKSLKLLVAGYELEKAITYVPTDAEVLAEAAKV